MSALQKLGVESAQGYLLGRPMPLVQATKRHWKPHRTVNEQEDLTKKHSTPIGEAQGSLEPRERLEPDARSTAAGGTACNHGRGN